MRFSIFTILLFCMLSLVAFSSAAQTVVTGDLTGTITDPSGAVVSGATVTATNLAENSSQTTATTASGIYRFAFVKPSQYRLTVMAKGFKESTEIVQVSVGQIATANFALELGVATEVVEVTGEQPLIQSENADVQTSYNQLQLEALPAPGGDITSYAYTAPGVVVSNGVGVGNFSSFGLPSTSNLFTVNGNDTMDPFSNVNNSGASNLTLGANELQEISVIGNGYTAQYGRQAGAQVNAVTKSGSNSFHGNAFYGYNGSVLNANDWFSNAAGAPRPHAVNNMFYASAGGPIVKNKLFFFTDYEGLHIVLPGVSGTNFIPSAAFANFVQGNVPSAARAFYQNIFSLYAGAPGSSGATAVTAGTDPALGCGDFSGTAGFGKGGTACALQFTSGQSNLTTEWLLATRVDYKISDHDTIFVRYQMDRGVQATATDAINPVFNETSIQPQYDGQLTETHVFNPTTTNNLIVSGSWYKAIFGPPNLSAAIAKFPTTMAFGDGLFTTLGGIDNASPQGRIPTQYQIVDDFSKTIGGHDIKVGLNFRRNLVSDYSQLIGTSGTLNILSMTEFANGVTAASPSSFYNATFTSSGAVRVNYYSVGTYAQDQWKVNQKLNLTLALRVDRNSNPVCPAGCFARMQGAFQSVSHDPAVPYNATIQTGLHNAFSSVEKAVLSPRFGFAYSFDSKTVLRGGFGIFDDLFPAVAVERFINNAPNVNSFSSATGGESLAPGPGSVFAEAATLNAAFHSQFSSGLTVAGLGGHGPNYYTMANKLNNPKFAEWSLELQRQIGSRYSAQLTYVGNHGYDIMTIDPWLNAFCRTASCAAGKPFGGVIGSKATDPRFGEIVDLANNGYSNYHGITAVFKVRPTHGFSGAVSYTWSHDLDTCSNNCLSPFVANTLVSLRYQASPLLPGNAYGNADYDVRHNFNLNYVYQSPAKGSSALLRHLTGGWTLAGTLFFHTGLPWSPVDLASRSDLGNVTGLRNGTPLATFAGAVPNVSCGHSAAESGAGIGGAPCVTASEFAVGTQGFGNSARNSLRGPGFFNTDLSLTKNFKLGERMGFTVGATAFNVLNHQNFDLPVNSVTNGLLGSIISTVGSNTSPYGSGLGAPLNGRIVQVTGKFTF